MEGMNNTDQVKILWVARESNESSVDNEVDPQIDVLTTNTSNFRFCISDFVFQILDFRFWMSDFGCQILNFRF